MIDIKSVVLLTGAILFIQSLISDNVPLVAASREIEPLRSLLSYVLKSHDKSTHGGNPKIKQFTEDDGTETTELKENSVKDNDDVKKKNKPKHNKERKVTRQKRRSRIAKDKNTFDERVNKDIKEIVDGTENKNERENRDAIETIDGMDFKIEASQMKEPSEIKDIREPKDIRDLVENREFVDNQEPAEKEINENRQNKPVQELPFDVFKAVREKEKMSEKHHKHRGKKFWKKKYERRNRVPHASQETPKVKKYKQKIENIVVSSEVMGGDGKDLNITRKVGLDKPVDIIVHIKMTK